MSSIESRGIQAQLPSESLRSALLLRTWEAISVERELPGVLAALADVLAPVVPFDAISIVDFGNSLSDHDQHRLFALHVVDLPRLEGESSQELAERTKPLWKPLPEVRPEIPYPAIDVTRSEEWLAGE